MPLFRKSSSGDPAPGPDLLKALMTRREQALIDMGELYCESTRSGRVSSAALKRKAKEIEALDARIAATRAGHDPGSLPPQPAPTDVPRAPHEPCRKCGGALAPSDRFCLHCGQPTPVHRSLRPCPSCNRGVEESGRFCNHCGSSMTAAGRLRIRHPLTGQEASFEFQPVSPPLPAAQTRPMEADEAVPPPPPPAPAPAAGVDLDDDTDWARSLERFARPSAPETAGFIARGRDLMQGGRHREAAVEFEAAVLQHPRDAAAHYNLGVARFKSGDVDSAVQAFERSLRLDRTNADAHNDLGLCHARLRQWRESLEHYEQALRLAPSHSDAHYNLAHLLIEQGAFPDAIIHLEMYLRHSPRAQDFKKIAELIDRLRATIRSGPHPPAPPRR